MHGRCSKTGARVARTLVVLPVTALAWTLVATPSALAAPASNNANANASANANGGVGNGVGVGNAKHDTSGTSTGAGTTTSSTDSTAGSHATDGTAGTSGDPSQPQPVSNADANSGGANGQCPGGPYCSTRDGSPSGNGNGKGKAVGKPCAGCVGKADNKNPKGQMPNGSDHNAGYECDRNHGIGRTNPAHTGCKTSDGGGDCTTNPTAPGCTNGGGDCTTNPTGPGCTNGGGDCTTNPTGPGCTTGGTNGCVPTSANNFCSSVLGEKKTRVLGERVSRSLPFTGAADLGWMLATGTLTLGLGGALLAMAGRRRRTA